MAAQGELPQPPRCRATSSSPTCATAQDEVGTLDYSRPEAPAWSVGRAVLLAELALHGLKRWASEKTLNGPRL
jgi:hypothetical protein